MKIAALQHDVVWEDAKATHAHVAPMIEGAAGAGARIVVLTEMFATGFSLDSERIQEPPDGPSATFLAEQARLHGVWVAASIPTNDPALPRPVNRFVLAGPNGETSTYDKIHPFSYAKEHERYAAGTRHVTVDVEGLRCSLFVCYDLRFADEFWALAHDTDCFLIVANWPESRRHHWQSLLVARAIENQAYVVGVNRVGEGGRLVYSGDSRIIDPLGEVIAGGARTEATLIAEVDPAMVRDVRARFRSFKTADEYARSMTQVRAEITANVWQVRTAVGAVVAEDDELVILESMKMEIPVTAPHAGTVTEVKVAPDDKVSEGDVLVVLEP